MIAKKLLTTIAFAFVLLFSGCAEDDFIEVDGLCPLVVSTVPEDGDIDVPLNQVITATFNEIMNPSTITGASFTVSANGVLIAGTVSYNGLTATFRPTLPLEPDTEYTGTITTLAKDPRGNALQENYVWTFTTLPEFTITIITNPTPGPITTGAGVYLKGTAVTITAAAYANYTFTNWTTVGGVFVSALPTYTLPPLMDNVSLVANYSLVVYEIKLSASPLAGGTPGGAGFYNYGSTATVTANPAIGYNFVNWTENGVIVPNAGATYAFTVTGARTLQANYILKTYTLTVTVIGTGTGTVTKSPLTGPYNHGSTVTLTPQAAPGSVFAGWSGADGTGNNNPLSVLMNGNKNITATFNLVQYNITLLSNPIQGRTEGTGAYPLNTVLTVKAIAEPGYTFSNWTEGGNIVLNAGANYTFTVSSSRTLTANFTAIPPLNAGLCPNPAVNLGLAGNYAVLAESAISTTGVTSVTGDMGISPLAATFITGFGLTLHSSGTYSTSSLVTGKIYAADYTSPTPSNLTVTVDNMHTAFTTANGLAPNFTEYLAGNLNNVTLPAGVYKYGTGLLLTNTITLDGGGVDCAAFVFQIAGDLTVANNVKIVLINGAKADNIFWVTAGAGAVIGTDVDFSGNILSKTLISLEARSVVKGRLLAQTAVSLIGNTVVKPN